MALAWLDGVFGTRAEESGYGLLSGVATLVLLWPVIATTVKRLHDHDQSGWLVLAMLIPLVGFIIWVAMVFRAGTVGPNDYGEAPAPTFAL